MPSLPHRFNDDTHEYVSLDGSEIYPNVTGMLWAAGLVDDRFMTKESRWRGSVVHKFAERYDLGAVPDVTGLVDGYKNYCLAYVAGMQKIPHEWDHIEVSRVAPTFHFASTLDRDGIVLTRDGVMEIKTTAATPSKKTKQAHGVQTALQAILRHDCGHPIEPRYQKRVVLYLFRTGAFVLEPFDDLRDLDEAARILKRYARG